MSDDILDLVKLNRQFESALSRGTRDKAHDEGDDAEESCAAFGYLRGVRDRALALEFRFKDGNADWLSYSCLTSWRFNPSVGLLLKFSADVVTLVQIRGSNLDVAVNQSGVDLAHGIQRHRVLWAREMDNAENRKVG